MTDPCDQLVGGTLLREPSGARSGVPDREGGASEGSLAEEMDFALSGSFLQFANFAVSLHSE